LFFNSDPIVSVIFMRLRRSCLSQLEIEEQRFGLQPLTKQ